MGRVVKRAYKYRFYPTPAQADLLNRTFGCVRLVYNWALAERTRVYATEHRSTTYARYPRFKSKRNSRASAEYTRSAFRWRDGHLTLAKIDQPLNIHWSRPLPDGARLDAGLDSLVALSIGEKITNPRHERADRRKLANAQRNLSSKQKGSANRVKARVRVARVHARITARNILAAGLVER